MHHLDPEKLKIPAYLRKKGITTRARQKLILTALDRKMAGLPPNSKRALAPSKLLKREKRSVKIFNFEKSADAKASNQEIKKLVPIGKVIAYYEKIEVAIIHLETLLHKGESIQLSSKNFLFQQPVDSMQIDRRDVEVAEKGSDIGVKVAFSPIPDSVIYKILK